MRRGRKAVKNKTSNNITSKVHQRFPPSGNVQVYCGTTANITDYLYSRQMIANRTPLFHKDIR